MGKFQGVKYHIQFSVYAVWSHTEPTHNLYRMYNKSISNDHKLTSNPMSVQDHLFQFRITLRSSLWAHCELGHLCLCSFALCVYRCEIHLPNWLRSGSVCGSSAMSIWARKIYRPDDPDCPWLRCWRWRRSNPAPNFLGLEPRALRHEPWAMNQ